MPSRAAASQHASARKTNEHHAVQYARYDIDLPDRWALYLSPSDEPVVRLVMFVHGFGGKAVGTWLDFPVLDLGKAENQWWREADLLFVGYESTRDSITAVANRIRTELGRFYPKPYQPALEVGRERLRPDTTTDYQELILVGHSLGGVVLRRALCDSAQAWFDDGCPSRQQVLLTAKTRLFSPASAGFRAAGWLGFLRATSFWTAIEAFLQRSSAYTDLQPGSLVLDELRSRTVQLVTR